MASKGCALALDIQAAISDAVNAGLYAGRVAQTNAVSDTYKATEKRLYAYPVLCEKITDDTERLQDLMTHGAPERSKSIMRYKRPGVRLSSDEILQAIIQDLKATIAADQYEADTMNAALRSIDGDEYYDTVAARFIHGLSDGDIAAKLNCDASTVRRNRGRLVRRLAVRLYGAQAV